MLRMTMAQAITLAQQQEMQRDKNVFLIGEDVGTIGGSFATSINLLNEFGSRRVIDTPICENGFSSLGVGAALAGLRPIVEISFMDFVAVGIDPIINQAAKLRLMCGGQVKVPIVFRMIGGMLSGAAAQHTQDLEAIFVHVPGLKVVYPSTPDDAKGLLKSAIRDDNPVVVVEPKGILFTRGDVDEDPDKLIPIGKAKTVREGTDVSILTYGQMVRKAVEAAAALEKQRISAEIIDLRTLTPLDGEAILATVKKTGRVIVAADAVRRCSVGSEVVSFISTNPESFAVLKAPIVQLGADSIPLPYNPVFEAEILPQPQAIVDSAVQLMKQ